MFFARAQGRSGENRSPKSVGGVSDGRMTDPKIAPVALGFSAERPRIRLTIRQRTRVLYQWPETRRLC